MNKKNDFEYSGNSAPFHVGPGLMLFNKGLSFMITNVEEDANNSRGLEINDENSLRQKLIRIIERKYNSRINNYKLKYRLISSNDISKLKIKKYKFKLDDNNDSPGGKFELFPNAFACKSCGHYLIGQKINEFEPKKCNICSRGEYEQVSLLRYCEECGNIDKFYYKCPEHGTDYIILDRGDKDNLYTWNFKCNKCDKKLDIFRFDCQHNISKYTDSIKEGKSRFKPITIREAGIFSPVVVTNIDLPRTDYLSNVELNKELIIFGFYLGVFKNLIGINNVSDVYNFFLSYNTIKNMKIPMQPELENNYKTILSIIEELENIRKGIANEDILREFNELSVLKGIAEGTGIATEFSSYIKKHEKEDLIVKSKIDQYEIFKQLLNLSNVYYIPSVKIIMSLIGIIKGTNKFWDDELPPHFELFWDNLINELINRKSVDRLQERFSVYSYPFDTEGILIEFNPKSIVSWINGNNLLENKFDFNTPNEFLLKLDPETNEMAYNYVYTLLHTFSHIILKKIHLFTGLGIDSCGEKIFVNGGSVFLYSNNNLNIGGLQYLFENKMFVADSILNSLYDDVNDCSFDPLCMNEKGSCFSCLYIPDFVCCNFNMNLDRNVFVGNSKRKIIKSYWECK
ncbi:MAG TPA: hypothetical protein PKO31_05735 [Methanofastidiosum sp.]|nr:hypothetical protein [Methanofastidiosum sp.]